MTPQGLQQLVDLAEQRNKTFYQWLRHLILLAAGGLTVLVSLNAGTGSTGTALWALRLAWAGLGCGILSGSACLYGEVWIARQLPKRLWKKQQEAHQQRMSGLPAAAGAPVATAPLPWRYRCCESICYLSLATAVIALVVFAWLHTGGQSVQCRGN